jgi:hypothetical protein
MKRRLSSAASAVLCAVGSRSVQISGIAVIAAIQSTSSRVVARCGILSLREVCILDVGTNGATRPACAARLGLYTNTGIVKEIVD